VRLNLSNLTDMDLLSRTETLRNTEHQSMTDILQHLIEIEIRRLDLDLGYSSLFDYCIECLEYSASAAGRRIQAARCIRRYPVVLEMLEKRELSLSTISQIEGILTDDNYKSILERVKGAPSRDVEKIACEYRPPLKFRDRVRPVCVAKKAALSNEDARGAAQLMVEKKMLVQLLASEEQVEKIEKVKLLLSGINPNMPLADVIEVLADEYLERHSPEARQARREMKKGSASLDSRRRECKNTQPPRDIPDAVRDEVSIRDGGQCTFVSADGRRCECKIDLEIDHINPYAVGGSHDLSNLRLLCGGHNKLAAEKAMGKHAMQPYWRRQ
jgi:5-methylcytosine-specific restriction endonuclease McrA